MKQYLKLSLNDALVLVLENMGLFDISYQPHKSKWTEAELERMSTLLSYGADFPQIKQFYALRSSGAIIKKAYRLGYRCETNGDNIIEFKYGVKSRNRRTKANLIEAEMVPEVAEGCEECSVVMISRMIDEDKLLLAEHKLKEALFLVNELKSDRS